MTPTTQRRAHRAQMIVYWRGLGRLPSPQGAAQGQDAPAAAGGDDGFEPPVWADRLPQPRRRDDQPPCGECHLQDCEVCDICGAAGQATDQGVPTEDTPTDQGGGYPTTDHRGSDLATDQGDAG